MNAESLSYILQFWKREFERKLKIPTQYPNSDQLEEEQKRKMYCEISTGNELPVLDGTQSNGEGLAPTLFYTETGDMIFSFFTDRGKGEGDFYEVKDKMVEIFNDRFIGPVQFFEVRIVPLVPVDEKWLLQVIAPYETCYSQTQKEAIL